jgi:hypothetical protein
MFKKLLHFIYTVKPVLRGHLWDKDKVPYKTGDLLKEVQKGFKKIFYSILHKN